MFSKNIRLSQTPLQTYCQQKNNHDRFFMCPQDFCECQNFMTFFLPVANVMVAFEVTVCGAKGGATFMCDAGGLVY